MLFSIDITLTWNSAVDTNSYTVSGKLSIHLMAAHMETILAAEGRGTREPWLILLGSWSIYLHISTYNSYSDCGGLLLSYERGKSAP